MLGVAEKTEDNHEPSVTFCSCHSSRPLNMSFSEQLLLIYARQNSLQGVRQLIEELEQGQQPSDDCVRKRNSFDFFKTVTGNEAWMLRMREQMFKTFKRADRDLWRHKITFEEEQEAIKDTDVTSPLWKIPVSSANSVSS